MARIEFNPQNREKSTAPEWINPEALNKASAEEAKRTEEMLSKIESNQNEIVVSWSNPGNGHIYQASDSRLLEQARIAKAAGKEVSFTDPNTGEALTPYKKVLLPVKTSNLKQSSHELRVEGIEKEAGYNNTFVDRQVVYKVLEALQVHAAKNGLTLPRARYIKGEYNQSKTAFGALQTFASILTEIEWHYGRNQKGRIFCKASVDPAGKIEMPKVFKIASGDEFEFSQDNIKALEKDSTFREMMNIKPKKTDVPTFRRPDISRFMATASMNKESNDPNNPMTMQQPQSVVTPQTPGTYTPGQQMTNPADGKVYTIKNYDPAKGAIVTSPEGQDMAVPANEVPNLKPNVQTQGAQKDALTFSVEAMADELIKKHLEGDIKEDTEHAQELHELGNEEKEETEEDRAMIDKLTNKKTADFVDGIDPIVDFPGNQDADPMNPDGIEFGNNPVQQEPILENTDPATMANEPIETDTAPAMEEGVNYLLPDGSGATTMTMGSDFDKLPKLKVKSSEQERVANMAKRWSKIRASILKEEVEKGDAPPFEVAPDKLSREQQEVQRLTAVGYKGFSPLKNDANEAGRDKKTHIPTKSSGNVEIGMTDVTDYGEKPFREAEKEMVERREHFTNENKLGLRGLKRNELKTYIDGKDEKEYGLSEEGREGDFENPDPFRKKSSITDDDLAAGLVVTAEDIPEEGNVEERPIVHKDIKRAPGLEGWKEPETIDEASGKAKEAITKFRKVQDEIAATKKKLADKLAPIQKKMMDTQKPFQEDLKKQQESLTTYLEMIWNQLGEVDNKIAAYEDKIFAAVERSKEETAKVSLAQLLAKLEADQKDIYEAVMKTKEAMENEKVTSVLERFLYEYPVSKEHEKKKVVRRSSDDNTFAEALSILKAALMSLLNLGDSLEV